MKKKRKDHCLDNKHIHIQARDVVVDIKTGDEERKRTPVCLFRNTTKAFFFIFTIPLHTKKSIMVVSLLAGPIRCKEQVDTYNGGIHTKNPASQRTANQKASKPAATNKLCL